MKIKEAIILNYRCHSQTQRVVDEGDPTPQFNWFVKKQNHSFRKFSKKDTIIDCFTKQLVFLLIAILIAIINI